MAMKSFASAFALASLAAAGPALAQDAAPFSGARVAVTGGWDRIDHNGENGSGFTYGGTAGYDVALGNFRVAPEVEVTASTQKSCFAEASVRHCERADRDFYAGARLGYVVVPKLLLYAKAGYTNARFTDRYTRGTGATIITVKDHHDRSGVRGGVGAEYALTPRFFLTSEYRYSNYSDDVSRHQIIGGVGVRF
jgi:outer membrane immunogenic protein